MLSASWRMFCRKNEKTDTNLVTKAAPTMTEEEGSVKQVLDLMGETSAASSEQSTGVSQVDEAVVQMDQATQQNAAAAGSVNVQVGELVSMVAVIKLQAGTNGGTYRPRWVAPVAGTAQLVFLKQGLNASAQRAVAGTLKLTVKRKTVPPSQMGTVLPSTSLVHGEGKWG